ncbi:MAG: filamentous hemagglutinin N-terminal domain-containing protein, partial [Neisseriaceae bacterium]|nr:filamentous hemagglutinin N-terminal domain-containing protein [Neisseriaceae bacterium]
MNSQLYKVIYSKTAGRFVVVSDIATNNGKSNANINSNIRARSLVLNLKEIVVSLLLIGSLSETVYAKSQIFADRNAPKNNQAQVLKTANGIAQINITTPTKRGVSMNQYRQFDIDTEGAVLNNSRKATETKLGGWISGNQNLNKSEAKVIVNQVNSNNPSQLKGYIEVGGKKAEVIVANPSGISVDGGGFINASKAQIISGSVQFNNDEVKGFNVHKHNKITIQKNGLDVSDTEYTQIISAANEINGKIYGKSIKVSAVTGNVDKDGNSESTQNVSVDVSHLGGMYAGKITMVGNKNGFAVNNAGQLIANSQINIDADGNINNKPTGTIAAKEIKLKAKNFNNQGRTEGSDSIRTDLGGDLNNSGSLSSNGSILINAITGWLNNSGTINSNKLIANTANFNNTGILNIASLLDMVFKGGLNNAGTISNSGATTLRTNSGDITNSGTIKSSQLTAYTDNLNNSGLIAATNLISTYLSGSLNNSGLINSNGTTNINAAHGDINNSGEINGNQINLTTQNLNNAENGTINALSYLNANLSEQLNNRGTINSNGTFQINGATAELNNTGNINSNNLIANIYNLNNYEQLNIKSNLLTNLSGRLYNEGEINSNGIAEIRSTNDIDNIGSIISQELKTNSNNINNHGRISVIAAMESNIAGSLNNRG